MPETSIPLGGIHLKLLRLSLDTRSIRRTRNSSKTRSTRTTSHSSNSSLKVNSYTQIVVCSNDISGGYSDGVPPLPIPNREVKPDRADGTAHPWESRSPPFYESPEFNMNSGLFWSCKSQVSCFIVLVFCLYYSRNVLVWCLN